MKKTVYDVLVGIISNSGVGDYNIIKSYERKEDAYKAFNAELDNLKKQYPYGYVVGPNNHLEVELSERLIDTEENEELYQDILELEKVYEKEDIKEI